MELLELTQEEIENSNKWIAKKTWKVKDLNPQDTKFYQLF